jgi:polyvinyl alcohol dehydrogenase (cytochrome)
MSRIDRRRLRPRARLLVLVGAFLAALAMVSSAVSGDDEADWSTIGHDAANSRNQPLEHAINASTARTLVSKWVATTTGDVSGTPAVVDGAVYFGDFGGTLWRLDADTGAVIWSHKVSDYTGIAGDLARTSPSLTGNTLVVGDLRGPFMLGVDATTGLLLWKTQVHPDLHGIMTGSPVLVGDTVITGVSASGASAPATATFRGAIVALNAQTGQILWQTYSVPDNQGLPGGYAGGTMFAPPAVDVSAGLVYGTFGNPYREPASLAACNAAAPNGFSESCEQPGSYFESIVAFDLATGQPRWSYRVWGHSPWQSACGSQPATVTWCAPEADHEKWDLGGSGANVFRIGQRDVVGVGGKSGVYYTLDARTGELVWNTLVGPGGDQGGFEWGTAYDGTHIYVSLTNHHHIPYQLTQNGVLSTTTATGGSWAALDPATGKILWQTADPQTETVPGFAGVGVWDLAPVSSANGVVYAASMAKTGNEMYALDAATGAIVWGYAAGSSVNAAPAIVDGSVYWGSGYARSGVEGSGNTKLFGFGLALPLLARQIAGMNLDDGLTRQLTRRLNELEERLASSADVCGGLGDFLKKVIREAGGEDAALPVAQAGTIVAAANAVEGQLGCPAAAQATAEQDVLALIGAVNALNLDDGLARDLRAKTQRAGVRLAQNELAAACQALDQLGKTIARRSGRNGLTPTQAAQLSAATTHIAAEVGC